jgi:hypothetical protein
MQSREANLCDLDAWCPRYQPRRGSPHNAGPFSGPHNKEAEGAPGEEQEGPEAIQRAQEGNYLMLLCSFGMLSCNILEENSVQKTCGVKWAHKDVSGLIVKQLQV